MSSTHQETPFATENEVQLPLPLIQPEYTFLPDDAVNHIIPPIDSAFLDQNPNVIHYDIFAGMHFNLVDPFKYMWNSELLGQPALDAEDLALFPPEIIEELIKDPTHKVSIPSMSDIGEARHRLLNMANFFHPDGSITEEEKLAKEAEKNQTKTLSVIKPYMFTDEYSKAKTMESAQANAMNYYYQPVYTEDTIQTWVHKRKYIEFAEKQKDLSLIKNLGAKVTTVIPTTVSKDPQSIKDYIDDSFAAMDEEPIHPDHPTMIKPLKSHPFFVKTLEDIVPRTYPMNLPSLTPEQQAKYNEDHKLHGDDRLVWVNATAETHLSSDIRIIHEKHTDTNGRVVLDGYSLYRNIVDSDKDYIGECEEDGIDVDAETKAILGAEYPMDNAHVWESFGQRVPVQQLAYEDSFIARYDVNGNIVATTITERVRLKPFAKPQSAIKHEEIKSYVTELPHIITVNNDNYYTYAFEQREEIKPKKLNASGVGFLPSAASMERNGGYEEEEYRGYGMDDEDAEEEEEDGDEIDLFAKPSSVVRKEQQRSKKDKKDKKDRKDKKDKKDRKDKKDKKDRKDRDDGDDDGDKDDINEQQQQEQPAVQDGGDNVDAAVVPAAVDSGMDVVVDAPVVAVDAVPMDVAVDAAPMDVVVDAVPVAVVEEAAPVQVENALAPLPVVHDTVPVVVDAIPPVPVEVVDVPIIDPVPQEAPLQQ